MKKIIIVLVLVILFAGLAVKLLSGGSGYVKVVTPGADISLSCANMFGKNVHLDEKMGQVSVAAGTYRPEQATVIAKHNGDNWIMRSRGPWGELKTIEVGLDETTELKFGPPFEVKTNVSNKGRAGSVGLSVVGRAGEHYQPLIVEKGKQPPAAKAKIVDEKGTVLASGRFEYG